MHPAFTSTPTALPVGLLNNFPLYGFYGELAASLYDMTMMLAGLIPCLTTI